MWQLNIYIYLYIYIFIGLFASFLVEYVDQPNICNNDVYDYQNFELHDKFFFVSLFVCL